MGTKSLQLPSGQDWHLFPGGEVHTHLLTHLHTHTLWGWVSAGFVGWCISGSHLSPDAPNHSQHHLQSLSNHTRCQGSLWYRELKKLFIKIKSNKKCNIHLAIRNDRIKKMYSSLQFISFYYSDFGYYRKENSSECVEEPDLKGKVLEFCLHGTEEGLRTNG